MHDLNALRQNPDAFDAALARRGLPAQAAELLALDTRRRALITEIQQKLTRRNEASQQIGAAKKSGADASALLAEVASLKEEIPAKEAEEQSIASALNEKLAALPNRPAADVPDGADETGNKELRFWGRAPQILEPLQHFELGEKLGMDFAGGARLSGARFTVLRGTLARLERALGDFMLDLHTQEHGYTEVSPPLLVLENMMFGTGQLPKFREDQFAAGENHWLIPTAEVPLTNLVHDQILDEEQLPLRFVARTPCFRAEAGAAGKDTRGMLRQHQFTKVELVSITRPEDSIAEHERMTECAEAVLKKLGLSFRTLVLCSGDMGFSAEKTYDLEVWLPGQNCYREISSCSNCGDFQARRMKARFRRGNNAGGNSKGTEFVHTLNGSGVAVGRCLIALLENYQKPDGSIFIPEALRPYLNGHECLTGQEYQGQMEKAFAVSNPSLEEIA